MYLTVDYGLGHGEDDGVADGAHVGCRVLCQLLQEAVKATCIFPREEAIADGLWPNFTVLLEEHGRAKAASLHLRRGGC